MLSPYSPLHRTVTVRESTNDPFVTIDSGLLGPVGAGTGSFRFFLTEAQRHRGTEARRHQGEAKIAIKMVRVIGRDPKLGAHSDSHKVFGEMRLRFLRHTSGERVQVLENPRHVLVPQIDHEEREEHEGKNGLFEYFFFVSFVLFVVQISKTFTTK